MVSHRPYRRAMSSEQAIEELKRCAGAQFDPAVVDAFVTGLARPSVDAPRDENMPRVVV
jgi:HD-GYP domain-containing protein (c-di-GMP phosphodiesterase class II)